MKRQKTSDFIVDTNGRCFICSSAHNSDKLSSSSTTPASYLSSLHALSQYLKIDISEVFHEKETIPPELLNNVKSSKLKVLLCEKCAKWNTRIAALSLQLEKIETEVCFYVKLIHGSLLRLEDDKTDHRPYNLDNDEAIPGGLLEKVRIVKSLRTETRRKCSKRLKFAQPIVKVQNLTAKQLSLKQRRIKSKSAIDMKSKIGYVTVTDNTFGGDMNHIKNEGSDTEQNEYFDDHGDQMEDPISDEESNNAQNVKVGPLHHTGGNESYLHLHTEPVTDKNPKLRRRMVPSSSSIQKIEKLLYVLNPETGKFPCNICSVECTTKQSLKNHYDSIHLKIRHKCNLCGKEFAHKRDCTRHHRSAHVGVRFKCNFCGQCFTRKFRLIAHQQSFHLGK